MQFSAKNLQNYPTLGVGPTSGKFLIIHCYSLCQNRILCVLDFPLEHGRGVSVQWFSAQGRGVSVQGVSAQGRGVSAQGVSVQEGLCPEGVSILGGLCPGGLCPGKGGLCH